MTDPIAIWGAVTGTAGLSLSAYRELRNNKQSLEVEHGWQYLFRNTGEGDELFDVWVYVMAWNTGRRPLHIEYAGFDFLVPGPRELADAHGLPPENTAWINVRAEIALNGETIEVIPDGPSVKIWTRIKPILGIGIDPTDTPVVPYVATVPHGHWQAEPRVLLPRPPSNLPVEETEASLSRMAIDYIKEHNIVIAETHQPGEIHGLARLMLEGDVERSSEFTDAESLEQNTRSDKTAVRAT